MKPRGEAQCANAPEQSKKAPFPFPGSSSFTFPNSPLRAPISWRKSSPIWGSVTSSPPMLICPASATTQISRCLRWVQKLLCICFPRSILFYSFYSTLPHFIPFHSTPLHSTPLHSLPAPGRQSPTAHVASGREDAVGQVVDGEVGILGHRDEGHAGEHPARLRA